MNSLDSGGGAYAQFINLALIPQLVITTRGVFGRNTISYSKYSFPQSIENPTIATQYDDELRNRLVRYARGRAPSIDYFSLSPTIHAGILRVIRKRHSLTSEARASGPNSSSSKGSKQAGAHSYKGGGE